MLDWNLNQGFHKDTLRTTLMRGCHIINRLVCVASIQKFSHEDAAIGFSISIANL